MGAYLGILCQIVEGGDVQLELSRLGEFAKANPDCGEVVACNVLRLFQNVLAASI